MFIFTVIKQQCWPKEIIFVVIISLVDRLVWNFEKKKACKILIWKSESAELKFHLHFLLQTKEIFRQKHMLHLCGASDFIFSRLNSWTIFFYFKSVEDCMFIILRRESELNSTSIYAFSSLLLWTFKFSCQLISPKTVKFLIKEKMLA